VDRTRCLAGWVKSEVLRLLEVARKAGRVKKHVKKWCSGAGRLGVENEEVQEVRTGTCLGVRVSSTEGASWLMDGSPRRSAWRGRKRRS
jgi:hypothetical protein